VDGPLHARERREVGGVSGRNYLGAKLGLGFKGLTVASTPNFSTLPLTAEGYRSARCGHVPVDTVRHIREPHRVLRDWQPTHPWYIPG
jgi:hypothetical protein